MKQITPRGMQVTAWGTSAVVVTLAVLAWGQSYNWHVSGVYRLFPIFGLLAFSLMWSHYVASALRQYFKIEPKVLSSYFEKTSMVVLASILIHPALIEWQLWRDGAGLPPGSAKAFVGASAYWAVWLGIIAWTCFISYEFRRVFGKKWWWPVVQYASDVAMVLIFIHALRLGDALKLGWFRGVWFFYGATYVVALGYSYLQKYRVSRVAKQK